MWDTEKPLSTSHDKSPLADFLRNVIYLLLTRDILGILRITETKG